MVLLPSSGAAVGLRYLEGRPQRLLKPETQPDDKCEKRDLDNGRRDVGRDLGCKTLNWRAGAPCIRDHLGDLTQHRVGALTRGLNDEGSLLVERAAGDCSAGAHQQIITFNNVSNGESHSVPPGRIGRSVFGARWSSARITSPTWSPMRNSMRRLSSNAASRSGIAR